MMIDADDCEMGKIAIMREGGEEEEEEEDDEDEDDDDEDEDEDEDDNASDHSAIDIDTLKSQCKYTARWGCLDQRRAGLAHDIAVEQLVGSCHRDRKKERFKIGARKNGND